MSGHRKHSFVVGRSYYYKSQSPPQPSIAGGLSPLEQTQAKDLLCGDQCRPGHGVQSGVGWQRADMNQRLIGA